MITRTVHLLCAVLSLGQLVDVSQGAEPEAEARPYKAKTKVIDHALEEWTIECPDGRVIDLRSGNISVAGLDAVTECLGKIESKNGVKIKSKTVVKNGVVVSDIIEGTTCMSTAQAQKLCDIVDANPDPDAPQVCARPSIQGVLEDGQSTQLFVTLPDGRGLDVLALEQNPALFAELLGLLQQFEQENGVHISNVTRTAGGKLDHDRTLTLTFLTLLQIEAIDILFLLHGLEIAPELAVYQADADLRIQIGNRTAHLPLQGDVVIRRQPPQPGNVAVIPVEMVEMQLVSSSPIPVQLQLNPFIPTLGALQGCQGDGEAEMEFDFYGVIGLPNSEIAVNSAPIRLRASVASCCWGGRRPFRFNHKGVTLFHAEGTPLRAKLKLTLKEFSQAEVREREAPPER